MKFFIVLSFIAILISVSSLRTDNLRPKNKSKKETNNKVLTKDTTNLKETTNKVLSNDNAKVETNLKANSKKIATLEGNEFTTFKTGEGTCPDGCEACENNICTKCSSQFFLEMDATTNSYSILSHSKLFEGSCHEYCPTSSKENAEGNCEKCDPSCRTCSHAGNPDKCLSCSNKLMQNGKCVDNCDAGKAASAQNVCEPCDVSCATCCTPGITTGCLSCKGDNVLSNGKCLEKCPDGFAATADKVCAPCEGTCSTCDKPNNANECKTCSGKLLLDGKKCTSNCEAGKAPGADGKECQACAATCATCSTPTDQKQCTTCKENTFLLSGECLKQCPDKYIGEAGVCNNCDASCLTCSKSNAKNACLTCMNILDGTKCVDTCPAGKAAESGVCQSCNNICANCSSPNNENACTTCQYPSYQVRNTCVKGDDLMKQLALSTSQSSTSTATSKRIKQSQYYACGVKAKISTSTNDAVGATAVYFMMCYYSVWNSQQPLTPYAGDWGSWTGGNSYTMCPTGKFITQIDSKLAKKNTGYNGIRFKCEGSNTVHSVGESPWGTWQGYQSCPSGYKYIHGLDVYYQKPGGAFTDDHGMVGLSIYCTH